MQEANWIGGPPCIFQKYFFKLYFMFWVILHSNLIFNSIFYKIIFFPENPSESKGGSMVRSETILPGLSLIFNIKNNGKIKNNEKPILDIYVFIWMLILFNLLFTSCYQNIFQRSMTNKLDSCFAFY